MIDLDEPPDLKLEPQDLKLERKVKFQNPILYSRLQQEKDHKIREIEREMLDIDSRDILKLPFLIRPFVYFTSRYCGRRRFY